MGKNATASLHPRATGTEARQEKRVAPKQRRYNQGQQQEVEKGPPRFTPRFSIRTTRPKTREHLRQARHHQSGNFKSEERLLLVRQATLSKRVSHRPHHAPVQRRSSCRSQFGEVMPSLQLQEKWAASKRLHPRRPTRAPVIFRRGKIRIPKRPYRSKEK